jgi:hypothetical protein
VQTSCESDVDGKGGMIQHLFSGCMRSDVTCLKCKTASITRDPFVDIVSLWSQFVKANIMDSFLLVCLNDPLVSFLQSLDLKSHTTFGHENVSEQTSESSRPQANAQGNDVRSDVQVIKDSTSVSGVEEDAGKVGSLAKGMWDGAVNKGGGQNGADGTSSKIPVNQVRTSREETSPPGSYARSFLAYNSISFFADTPP